MNNIPGTGSSGVVNSFNGRSGLVVPATGDYSASMISGALVNSFNGRSGAVLPAAGDYTAAMIPGVPAINTQAATIAPIGAQAAGSSGQAADAAHVHATTRIVQTLSSDVTVGTGGATILATSTGAVGPGVWLFLGNAVLVTGTTTSYTAIVVASSGGTVTLQGAGAETTTAAGAEVQLSVFAIATVTAATTLMLNGIAGSASSTAKASTAHAGYGATGFVLLRIG
jgi:hypothetical protein